jgi:protoporphyrinogen oxidase
MGDTPTTASLVGAVDIEAPSVSATTGGGGQDISVVVIGAGPAGLTAAYQLGKAGAAAVVLETDSVVGGISRTAERDGWRFDIGGHRFFTKVREVEELWHEILPDEDFLLRPRLSRIYYDGKYFDYPLRAMNALRGLGVWEALRCVLSYAWVRVKRPKNMDSLEGWTASRFGWRLYRTFFKTYTEKVWGIPAAEIKADWAAQRIKNLSLAKAVINSVLPRRNQKEITSLIEEFQYPKFGPGMMWERARELVEAQGTKVLTETAVTRIRHEGGRAVAVESSAGGATTVHPATHVVSSMPFGALVEAMDPPPPPDVLEAARGLAYRDFLTVALIVPEAAGFPDNWIYVHSPDVRVGRIQNFGSWSPYLVKDGRTCLGLEYFVFEGDELWSADDEDLVARGKRELDILGLVSPQDVEAGYIVRMKKAYPTYDDTYRDNVDVLRSWIEANAPNVYPVGRNGMHKYNNQDHSMYTAMLSVENILGADHDIWAVNVEAEYHEHKLEDDGPNGEGGRSGGTGRDAPVLPRQALEAARARSGGG